MSNTGRNKKLASFNCDEDLWTNFRHQCQEKGTTATATLTQFISLYLDGSINDLDTYSGKSADTLDDRLNQQVKASVADYLDNYLATARCGTELQNTVVTLAKRVEDLENRLLKAEITQTNPNAKTRTRKSPTKSTEEREFWFIQERAKHLGLKVSTNQIIHIEMWANEAYKQRYGKPPGRKLFRNTQAFAYPAADVDLLDAAIRGIVARG